MSSCGNMPVPGGIPVEIRMEIRFPPETPKRTMIAAVSRMRFGSGRVDSDGVPSDEHQSIVTFPYPPVQPVLTPRLRQGGQGIATSSAFGGH